MSESVFASVAPLLIAGGYSPLPIGPAGDQDWNPKGKEPAALGLNREGEHEWYRLKNWNVFCKRQPHPATLAYWCSWPDSGVGVACGFGGLVAVDIDDDELIEPLLAVLPPVFVAKKGRKGLTVFYRSETPLQKKNYRTADNRGLADLLAGGSQTVLPPTVHPDTGKPYEWMTAATLLDTPLTALPLLTTDHIAAMEVVFARYGWNAPEPRQRQGDADARPGRATTRGAFADDDLSAAALANLSAWVPALGLPKLRATSGGYRAVAFWRSSGSGRDTGKRAPNLGFHPTGIRDFGGDGYSPVGVIMKALSLDSAQATAWLRDTLGIPDAPLIILHNGAGAPVAEPSYPDNRVPLRPDAESAVAALVGARFEAAVKDWRITRNRQFQKPSFIVPSPTVLVARIETGIGKTTMTIPAVADLARRLRLRIVYVVPRHDLAGPVATQFGACGVRAEVYRGYEQDDPRDPNYKMCRNLPAYEAARDLGVGIREAVCARRIEEIAVRCAFADVCGKERQREARPQVWIVPAALLPMARPDFVFDGGPEGTPLDALVIDERFHDHVFGKPETMSVSALARAKIESCNQEETAFLADMRQRLLTAVSANGDGPMKASVLGITPEQALRASDLEQRVCTPTLLSPDMGEAELKTKTYRYKQRTQLARIAGTVWEEIALFLAFGEPLSGRLAVVGDKITATPLRPVHTSWHAPTLILDATAPPEPVLSAALFGDNARGWPPPSITTTDITAHWSDHVHVRQIIGAPITMAKLGLYDGSRPENELDVLRFIQLRAALAAPTKVGLITYKGFIEKLRAENKIPANVVSKNFGALSGMNDMETVAGLIVVGRLSPRRCAVEATASVLAGRPVGGGGHHFSRVAGGIRMADGRVVHADAVRHPDAIAEAMREQVTEAELLQAAGRLRPHRRGEPCWLDIVCDVPLPITMQEVVDWVAPGGEADMAAAGVVLTNSRDAFQVFGLSDWEARNCGGSLKEALIRNSTTVSPRTVTYRKSGSRGPASTALYFPAVLPGGVRAIREFLEPKLGPLAKIEVERVRAKDSEAGKAMFAGIGRETGIQFNFDYAFSSRLRSITNFFGSISEESRTARRAGREG